MALVVPDAFVGAGPDAGLERGAGVRRVRHADDDLARFLLREKILDPSAQRVGTLLSYGEGIIAAGDRVTVVGVAVEELAKGGAGSIYREAPRRVTIRVPNAGQMFIGHEAEVPR